MVGVTPINSSRELLELRKPFEELEAAVLRRALERPHEVAEPLVQALRYVLNFAKLSHVRGADGRDHAVGDALSTHAWRVRDALQSRLLPTEDSLWPAVRVLPELVAATRERRRQLLEHFELDRHSLDQEIGERRFVLVLGGGGGAGYGYAGVFAKLHKYGVLPDLICGTSIGGLLGSFRARSRFYDAAALLAANRRLSWNNVFSLGPEPSRYGLPATLHLYLRRAIGDFFKGPEGRVLTMSELAIPLHIVATGLTVEALRHSLDYYEHFLDDVVRPGLVFRMGGLTRIANIAQIFSEFASNPQALREVVFGRDEGTEEMDVLDCAGFSAAVPGLLHYDVHRDDPRAKRMLDSLYAKRGITRLTEGGVVNNVPARVGFRSAMEGRLGGRRNCYILAVDCFPVKASQLIYYPIQQVARANVVRNIPYANLYVPLPRTLSPLALVPRVEDVGRASRWAMAELKPHMPLLLEHLRPIPPLDEVR